ncbi:MerR family transcriptional regulator [Bosea sp. (in: a-proteobacteria)]|jgi:DNA-binding transcriptional MerR regulator|uniref:MerR family transcriptional regulator n=1 Tax=Bosea sp. (in: a-proteobacteria) TaxID=1871050 RepID=UPI002DDCDFC8|nr:MerR family transcriptional regulator [Bosea sp. (in: a-proteobacteria)]HEV2512620.1 MerR family transcriptional regulator [Bosea sp. (in: a-proteobacteria)]
MGECTIIEEGDDYINKLRSEPDFPRPDYKSPISTIGDLACDFGVTLRTLRFYESRGLLSPVRSGTQRLYSAGDRARLALILKGKQLGFTLTEIRKMLAEEKKSSSPAKRNLMGVDGLYLSHGQIAEQLELLRGQQSELASAIAELEAVLSRATSQAEEAPLLMAMRCE